MPVLNSLLNLVRNVLGTSNEARVRTYTGLVRRVAALGPALKILDDGVLRERSLDLRQRARAGATLSDLQAEAFALVREACDRRLGIWHAIRSPELGFTDWGEYADLVTATRERLAAGEDETTIDLPAALYERVRARYPESVPPFRMRAFDVQIIGAGVLHDGCIAEMKTGEGKTLVAIFSCYLNSLTGQGVHVITTNDYLARRDAVENRPVFGFLGCSVDAIQADMDPQRRQQVYASDVVYGTNNEYGFDYLRDNLKPRREDQVQTRRDYAIVDEVDSVLIDEARTPLIISGPTESHEQWFKQADAVARQLVVGDDFEVELKDRAVTLTEEGIDHAARLFGVPNLYEADFMHLPHFLDNALRAHNLFHRDKEYLVQHGEIKIIDEFTGRVMTGRRWSDGLHQAIEAKEGVPIKEESQTYATITLQNFFRLYRKLAGMTGTAMTEADEFHAIYRLRTVAIPTNKPVVRDDLADLIFGSEPEKFDAVVEEVAELHAVGQPVLVGTISVDVSERLSKAFRKKGIKHNVLNARQHQREAQIIADAGQLGAVTIATNMAGRGVDIKLGRVDFEHLIRHWRSNQLVPKRLDHTAAPAELDEACVDLWSKHFLGDEAAEKLRGKTAAEVLEVINRQRRKQGHYPLALPSAYRNGCAIRDLGGLRIVGTERHEARRIDNQLRGRSGRQGDPGSSRFYLSLEDDLMKRFAGETMRRIMISLGLKDGIPIESRMVSRAVEKAQKRVEEYHYGIRKNLLEFDQVMNLQRGEIYRRRQRILESEVLDDILVEHFDIALDDLVQQAAADGTRGEELAKRIAATFAQLTGLPAPSADAIPVKLGGDSCRAALVQQVRQGLAARSEIHGEYFPHVLRMLLLDPIDRRWKDHLYAMDHLRHAIGLEGYGQKDPKMRYKEEGYKLFGAMLELIRNDVVRHYFRIELRPAAPPEMEERARRVGGTEGRLLAGGFVPLASAPPAAGGNGQPGPDEPCPCGSGKVFKQCHGVF
jgi:preprotein translocase subunit SecA